MHINAGPMTVAESESMLYICGSNDGFCIGRRERLNASFKRPIALVTKRHADSSWVVVSGDSEMIDIRVQSMRSLTSAVYPFLIEDYRPFIQYSTCLIVFITSRQELSTCLDAYKEGEDRPCCSEEDPRQRDRVRRSMTCMTSPCWGWFTLRCLSI